MERANEAWWRLLWRAIEPIVVALVVTSTAATATMTVFIVAMVLMGLILSPEWKSHLIYGVLLLMAIGGLLLAYRGWIGYRRRLAPLSITAAWMGVGFGVLSLPLMMFTGLVIALLNI